MRILILACLLQAQGYGSKSNGEVLNTELAKGSAALNRGDYSDALIHFKRVVTAAPELPHGHFGLGSSLLASGDVAGAVEALVTASSLSLHNELGASLPSKLAEARARQGDYNGAIRDLEAAQQLATDIQHKAGLAYNLGFMHTRLSRIPQAIAHLTRVLNLTRDHQAAHSLLGRILLTRDPSSFEALRMLRIAVKMAGPRATADELQSLVHALRRRIDDARPRRLPVIDRQLSLRAELLAAESAYLRLKPELPFGLSTAIRLPRAIEQLKVGEETTLVDMASFERPRSRDGTWAVLKDVVAQSHTIHIKRLYERPAIWVLDGFYLDGEVEALAALRGIARSSFGRRSAPLLPLLCVAREWKALEAVAHLLEDAEQGQGSEFVQAGSSLCYTGPNGTKIKPNPELLRSLGLANSDGDDWEAVLHTLGSTIIVPPASKLAAREPPNVVSLSADGEGTNVGVTQNAWHTSHSVLDRVEARAEEVLGLPRSLNYWTTLHDYGSAGKGYGEHTDCHQAPVANTRGYTLLTYMNTVGAGGETEFDRLGVKVSPRKGRVLLFSSVGEDDAGLLRCLASSIHRSNQVIDGTRKEIFQRWYYLREMIPPPDFTEQSVAALLSHDQTHVQCEVNGFCREIAIF